MNLSDKLYEIVNDGKGARGFEVALRYAAEGGHLEVCEWLVGKGTQRMNLSDKLYEIVDDRYDRFWRAEGVPKGCYFGRRHQPLEPSREYLLPKWHGMLRSHGMVASEEFVDQSGVICVKDPAILNNEWILVPEEMALKIIALGAMPW